MIDKLNWAASIEPGHAMLGLSLGMGLDDVREIFKGRGNPSNDFVTFLNSPRLIMDSSKEDVILLRAADMKNVAYAWQNVLARLVFSQNVLTSIVVISNRDDDEYRYQGKIFGKVGLGSLVSDLLDFVSLEYDDAEEVFYSDGLQGLEVGGTSACDLSVDQSQIVTFIRIFVA